MQPNETGLDVSLTLMVTLLVGAIATLVVALI